MLTPTLRNCALGVLLLICASCSKTETASTDTATTAAPADTPAATQTTQAPRTNATDNPVTTSDTSSIPADTLAKLREIGSKNDIAGTAALYAPSFPDGYLDDLQVARDQHYGPAERNVLDVMTKTGLAPGRPVLIFVHGGGFGAGNKSAGNSPFYDNIPYWAAQQDLVGVNVNYRYAPASQWPSGIEDLNQVIAWVKDNIEQYGGDPNQIFLWGKSTGASHVADYMAARVKNGQQPEIAGAIFTSGSFALGDEPLWANYYGDDVSLYPERNALPLLVQSTTPMMATYGEFDGEQYKEQFQLLLDAMNAAGKPLDTLYLQSHSHMSETYAVGTADTSLTGPVLAFIHSHAR
ncbi:MAG TPA: alpha/beta hydrolase [Hyphomicrobiales bacterium]|nr:alpha/beta hydrolase [Hyphomicrobiales bacterium]